MQRNFDKFSPPPDMLINEISKLFDDSIRKRSANSPVYVKFVGNKGFSARHILFSLERNKNPVNQQSLAKLVHLTPPTVCVALQKMEAMELIKREPNPDDMRETMVYITDKGIEFNNFIKNSIKETQNIMFQGVSDRDMIALTEILIKIKNNMTDGDIKL